MVGLWLVLVFRVRETEAGVLLWYALVHGVVVIAAAHRRGSRIVGC